MESKIYNAAMTQDEKYMDVALSLAIKGKGNVAPNPMVGCVIVKEGIMVGQGWHSTYGGAHAEKNAVNSITDKKLLKNSTVYVNLEPCSHFGNTPPCCDLLILSEVSKVIIANVDPNPLVNGKGIEKMRKAGLVVQTGILESKAKALNKEFFQLMEKKSALTN